MEGSDAKNLVFGGGKLDSTRPYEETGCVEVLLPNGTTQFFFIKVYSKEGGVNMIKSEFGSMNETPTSSRASSEDDQPYA
ncbi:uncharacterized protein N7529_000367 [Penicillium soppii]|uniref:uncharacterized protein n=1 Tax=Penicillium soppii TaxID=69789 RepID=UPI0025477BD4|nr:uncharacterized protein N7529_000367 [Penicillium soppii]KAJ5881695.1 hypothetical protein N7529_000367 [Penicillium soppii]